MAKAIVFDIGGVLIKLNMEACLKAFIEGLGFDRIRELLDPFHQKGIYGEMEAGHISADLFRTLILAESRPGCKAADVDNAMYALLDGMPEGTAQCVLELSARYPLYLLSNNNPIAMKRILEEFRANGIEPSTVFKGQFISCDMKLLKPSQECFQAVIDGIGLPAKDILFVDDSIVNVEAARAAGLDARLYIPGTQLSLLLADC
ncbi:MAG: HAD family phosphatase [Bacteroidales bacterium]|nr:HAD family phosphatase [Bacteroidales bacterium]